jgi:hypothetical protein
MALNFDKLHHVVERRLRFHGMGLVKHLRPGGVLPDLLVIGAMKAGTTTLFDLLCEHPGFVPPRAKEIHFFSMPRNFGRGEAWYRAHFPTARAMARAAERLGYAPATGEATPTMSTPMYAGNAARIVPGARLVVTLRDPVERAWSHYQHMRRHAFPERLDFAAAIDADLARYARGLRLTPDNFRRQAPALVKRGYVQRGHYAEQLEHWLRFFPRERMLVLNFDRWKRDPARAADAIARFVGLPPHAFSNRRANVGGYDRTVPADCRERLAAHYRPHNRRLYELLGDDWKSEDGGWPA